MYSAQDTLIGNWCSAGAEDALIGKDAYRIGLPDRIWGWSDPIDLISKSLLIGPLSTRVEQALGGLGHNFIKGFMLL